MSRKVVVVLLLAVALLLPTVVAANGGVSVVQEYEPALGPEGIATDWRGNVYVSLALSGQVRKIARSGEDSLLYDFSTDYPGTIPLGMATDKLGRLYVNVTSRGAPGNGVYRVRRGHVKLLPGTEEIYPNGMTFGSRGNLYVTESNVAGSDPPAGTIWRIPKKGEAELWFGPSGLLGGVGYLIPWRGPIGANGICYRRNMIYVANTEKGYIVQIPVLPDGSAGEPSILVGAEDDEELRWLDDIRMDVHGTIYAALVLQDRIVVIDPDTGEITDLAGPADGLDSPASIAFGKRGLTRKSIFFTNSGYGENFAGVMRLEVGVPGKP